MTAQVCESIIYKGKKLEMATEPLKVILDNRPELEFYEEWTSCWRGYHGTWEIADERLYLVELERDTSIIEDRQCIGEVFPNQNPPIFAEWFTGEIRLPTGEELLYVHMGYNSIHEKDILLQIESGNITSENEIDNRKKIGSLSDKEKYMLQDKLKWKL